ncbi:hypothetical protein AnigIFM49718_002095, partial [Aspergillus niger]
MDEQHPPPPLECKYSGGLRNELGISERLSGLAIAGEGSVSAAAPFRQNQEDTNATEPVEDHRKTLEALFSYLALRSVPESQECVHSSVGSAEGEPSYYDL